VLPYAPYRSLSISKFFCKDGGLGRIKGAEGWEGGELKGENKSGGIF
jgi:hypothetical protein